MRNTIFSLLLLWICGLSIQAQVPQAINYQAVAYGVDGKALAEKVISVKLEILQGSANGNATYVETHRTTTASNGVFNLLIGKGTAVTGTFSDIDWSLSPYFVRFSMDPSGNSSYKEIATSQLLSVPYALYAEKTRNSHSFTVKPMDGRASAVLLTGNTDIKFPGYANLFVSYEDGKDQQIEYTIEGLPQSILIKDESELSGSHGRYISFDLENDGTTDATYRAKFILKNKYGETKEYPFMYKTVKQNVPEDNLTPNDIWQTESDIRNVLADLIAHYQNYFSFNKDIDRAFLNVDGSSSYPEFRDKTYTPNDNAISELWGNGYALVNKCNLTIKKLSESTNSSINEDLKKNVIKQAKAIRGYTYLQLTRLFGNIPLILEWSEDVNQVLSIHQSSRSDVLAAVRDDLQASSDLGQLTGKGELTQEEIERLLCESLLLQQDWNTLSQMKLKYSSDWCMFLKKIADWKLNTVSNFTNASCMDTYKNNYMDSFPCGHLLLQALDYTATYLNMEAYKILMPIPQSEIDRNPAIKQNPGY